MILERKSLERNLIIENRIGDILLNIHPHIQDRVKSSIVYKDQHFIRRKDRTSNDIHLFLELKNNNYFHLKAYTKYMLLHQDKFQEGLIFLTGYQKSSIEKDGGEHSFRQDWYKQDSKEIVQEILKQNKHLF